MRKHIVCLGDSNTHGYAPAAPGGRYDESVRWPCLLQSALGGDCLVIEEGLSGRTTVFSDPTEFGMAAIDYVWPCLMSHEPVELLIIMLGTNDARECFAASPVMITRGLERLVRRAQAAPCWARGPRILIAAPAPLPDEVETDPFGSAIMGRGGAEKTRALPQLFRELAERMGCAFFDASGLVSYGGGDHMHLSAGEHARLAAAMAAEVKKLI